MENQQQLRVDLSQTTDVVCSECQSTLFVQAYQMKRLSALVSPTGQEALIPISTFCCKACGNINPEFQPTEQ
jgi:hypothetical protein